MTRSVARKILALLGVSLLPAAMAGMLMAQDGCDKDEPNDALCPDPHPSCLIQKNEQGVPFCSGFGSDVVNGPFECHNNADQTQRTNCETAVAKQGNPGDAKCYTVFPCDPNVLLNGACDLNRQDAGQVFSKAIKVPVDCPPVVPKEEDP